MTSKQNQTPVWHWGLVLPTLCSKPGAAFLSRSFFSQASAIPSAFWKQIPKRCLFPPRTWLEEDCPSVLQADGAQGSSRSCSSACRSGCYKPETPHRYRREDVWSTPPTPHPRAGFPALNTWKGNIIIYIKNSKAGGAAFHKIIRMFPPLCVSKLKAVYFCMNICMPSCRCS